MDFPSMSSDEEPQTDLTHNEPPANGSPSTVPFRLHATDDSTSAELPISSSGAAGSPPGTPGGVQTPHSLLHSCVRLVDTGLRFNATGTLFYDDVAGVLHDVVRGSDGDVLYSYSVLSSAMRKRDVVAHAIGAGPPVSLVCLSPDWRLLAMQRSVSHIEVLDTTTGNIIVQGPSQKRKHSTVLGCCWVTSPSVDFVLVTTAGLELYARAGHRTGHSLQLVDTKAHTIAWYRYSHETRVLLMAKRAGQNSTTMQAYQFSSRGVLKLPTMETACSPAPHHVSLVNLYGRVYCCVVDVSNSRLLMYRFYRNTVLLQHRYPLYDQHIALSCVDGLLLVHHRSARVTVVLDVCSLSKGPLGDPLPMTMEAPLEEGSQPNKGSQEGAVGEALAVDEQPAMQDNDGFTGASQNQAGAAAGKGPAQDAESSSVVEYAPHDAACPDTSTSPQEEEQVGFDVAHGVSTPLAAALEAASTFPASASTTPHPPASKRPAYVDLAPAPSRPEPSFTSWMPCNATTYSSAWRFEQPNVVLDLRAGHVYCVQVDLRGLAQIASLDLPCLLGVLLRRNHAGDPLLPRRLTIAHLQDALVRKTPVPAMLDLFLVVNTALRDTVGAHDQIIDQHVDHADPDAGALPGAPVAVLSPQAVHDHVLVWACQQPGASARYMAGVVGTFLFSLASVGVKAPPSLHCLLVDLRTQLGQEYQVAQLVTGKSTPPSTQLAEHLMLLQQQGLLAQGRLLAGDMLTPASTKWLASHGVLPSDEGSAAAAVRHAHHVHAAGADQETQAWLPATNPEGGWNVPALCAAQRVVAARGGVARLPIHQLLARLQR